MKNQVYVSCPLDENAAKISEVGRKLSDMGYSPWWFERGTTYDDQKLRLADMFVLIPSSNQFDSMMDYMTPGCKKELELAHSIGKSLWLAYWKKNVLHIYSIHLGKLADRRVMGQSRSYLQPYRVEQIINTYQIY